MTEDTFAKPLKVRLSDCLNLNDRDVWQWIIKNTHIHQLFYIQICLERKKNVFTFVIFPGIQASQTTGKLHLVICIYFNNGFLAHRQRVGSLQESRCWNLKAVAATFCQLCWSLLWLPSEQPSPCFSSRGLDAACQSLKSYLPLTTHSSPTMSATNLTPVNWYQMQRRTLQAPL